jgi:RNA methyltransferase, TrmH family
LSGLAYRHQRVQRLRRLIGRRSARKDEGRFVIEGVNLLEEAVGSQVPIEAVYVDSGWAGSGNEGRGSRAETLRGGRRAPVDPVSNSNGRLSALLDRSLELGARVFELEPGVLARVTDTVTPQPVVAVVETPKFELSDVSARPRQLVVVCVDVRDPGNAGTVVRSAWAAGIDAVLFCEGAVDPWNPKAVRSSAGAVLHVPVLTLGPPVDVLHEIGGWGWRRLAAVRDGGEDYATVDLTVPSAFVFGNEAAGLPIELLRQDIDGWVSIPMPGGAESLNVGMAAAVLCFEASRQRRLGLAGQARSDPPGTVPALHRDPGRPK